MFRSFFLLAFALGIATAHGASAAPLRAAAWFPQHKIAPGNHRPIYRRYGHHGLTRSLFTNLFRHNTRSGAGKPGHAKGHRGTL